MKNPVFSQVPVLPSVQQERALLMLEFGDKFGYDQEMIFALAREMTEYNFWFFSTGEQDTLNYTPSVALYLRDFFRTDRKPTEQQLPYEFDVEMRAVAISLYKYRYKALSMPLEEFYYDFLISLLTQHSERLRVCWEMSEDRFRLLPANEALVRAVMQQVHANPAPKVKFARWVLKSWLPRHFRHYVHGLPQALR